MSSKPNTKASNALLSPDEAIAYYENAVKSEATAANYLELGAAYYVAHRWEDARNAFEKVIELDPREGYGYFYLGVLYAAFGQREQAQAALEKVLQVSNNQMLKDQAKTRIPNVHSVADLGDN
ncbi:MAG TPA: tetratricopeptide repeat protein [Anaerolineae bacterium]|nr:tetratricopeptide repeat protein [Anaerolineae bacterium]